MSMSSHGADPADVARGRGRALVAILGTAFLALSVLLLGTTSAGIAAKSKTTIVLGSPSTVPDPSCPELPCQAGGSVTGFPVSKKQTKLAFRVPRKRKAK